MQGQRDLEEVSRLIMSELTPTVSAKHGAFFLADPDDRRTRVDDGDLKLIASYGYKKRKNLSNNFKPGEGIVGQAALEKKPILSIERARGLPAHHLGPRRGQAGQHPAGAGRSRGRSRRRDAGLTTPAGASREGELLKRIRAFAHVDDGLRGNRPTAGSSPPTWAVDDLSPLEQRLARMLFFSAFPGGGGFTSYDDGLAAIRAEHAASAELASVVGLVFDQSRHDAPAPVRCPGRGPAAGPRVLPAGGNPRGARLRDAATQAG